MPTAGRSGNQADFASVYGDDDILTPRRDCLGELSRPVEAGTSPRRPAPG